MMMRVIMRRGKMSVVELDRWMVLNQYRTEDNEYDEEDNGGGGGGGEGSCVDIN